MKMVAALSLRAKFQEMEQGDHLIMIWQLIYRFQNSSYPLIARSKHCNMSFVDQPATKYFPKMKEFLRIRFWKSRLFKMWIWYKLDLCSLKCLMRSTKRILKRSFVRRMLASIRIVIWSSRRGRNLLCLRGTCSMLWSSKIINWGHKIQKCLYKALRWICKVRVSLTFWKSVAPRRIRTTQVKFLGHKTSNLESART